jgi:hypothetical protein
MCKQRRDIFGSREILVHGIELGEKHKDKEGGKVYKE